MTTSDDLNERLQAQIVRLEEAMHMIQRGTVPDLAPLERDVSTLCQALLTAPGKDSRQTADKMREMIGLLEGLAHELKDFQNDFDEGEK